MCLDYLWKNDIATIVLLLLFSFLIPSIISYHLSLQLLDPENKSLMKPVLNQAGFGEDEVAYVYMTLLAGKKTPSSLKLFNKIVTEWQLSITMDKPNKVLGYPYTQALSINSNCWAFFSASLKILISGKQDLKISAASLEISTVT